MQGVFFPQVVEELTDPDPFGPETGKFPICDVSHPPLEKSFGILAAYAVTGLAQSVVSIVKLNPPYTTAWIDGACFNFSSHRSLIY
ncbi:MAG: hypothetical protein ACRD18_02340 [Terriglobia bacterium]